MIRTMPRGRRLVIGTVVVLAIAVAACTHSGPTRQAPSAQPSMPGTVALSPDLDATLTMPEGATVQVPRHAVAGPGNLTGGTASAPAPPPDGMVLAGPVYQLEVSGTSLTAPVALSFPAPPVGQADNGSAPASATLAFFDPATQAWTPVESRFDPATNTLSATSTHLSLWSAVRVDTSKVLGVLKDLLAGVIGLNDHTSNPQCSNESGIKAAGITVSSSSGNLVKWCVGTAGGSPQVKVSNNRGYAVAMSYPSSWVATPIGGHDDVEQAAISVVSRFAAPPRAGVTKAIVFPGKGLQFAAPPGSTGGGVRIEPDVESYLLSGLLFGVSTYTMTLDKLPWFGVRSDPSKTAMAISAAFAAKDCVTKMSTIANQDIHSAHDVGELFRNVAELTTSCLADAWKVAYGMTGWLASAAIGVLLWLVDGVKLVFVGAGAVVDTALYFNGYQLKVDQSAPATWATPLLTITSHSLGAVRLGMTATQAKQAAAVPFDDPTAPDCQVFAPLAGDGSVVPLMFLAPNGGTVVLVGTGDNGPIRAKTPEGIGAGSTTDDVQRVYGSRAVEHVDPYGSDVLIVDNGDGTGLRFDAYRGKGSPLSSIKGGQMEPLQRTEICG